ISVDWDAPFYVVVANHCGIIAEGGPIASFPGQGISALDRLSALRTGYYSVRINHKADHPTCLKQSPLGQALAGYFPTGPSLFSGSASSSLSLVITSSTWSHSGLCCSSQVTFSR